MRQATVKNKYKLAFADLKKLRVIAPEKMTTPLFWRNDVIKAWCISESTAKCSADREFGTYNDYFIAVYDEGVKENQIEVSCSAYGGMCSYKFQTFFDKDDIENDLDLEIQEKLLAKINSLIDTQILAVGK